VAPKGSVAIDGVSLTVNGVDGQRFDVVVIPHTQDVTTLGDVRVGGECNLEIDLLARYVARLLTPDEGESRDEVLLAKLKNAGFI
jgi:riboflavin synthase